MGGGKQLRMMGRPGGGGKQLRVPQQESEKESDSDSDSDDEPPVRATTTIVYNRGGGGKQLRPSGGKQLRVPEPESEDEGSDEEEEEEEEAEEEEEEEQPPPPPPPSQPSYQSGGKSLSRMQHSRGGGKQLRAPEPADEEESDSSDSDDEESAPVRVQTGYGGGKMLRTPKKPSEDEEDSDESKEEEADDMEIDSDEEEEEKPAPKRKAPPPPPKKDPSEDEADDMEESSSEDEAGSSSSESEEERELDMETFDTQKLVEDEEDQKMLDALPEIQREAILGERFEKLKNADDMKRALRVSKRKEREAKKIAKAGKGTKKKKPTRKAPAKRKGRSRGPDTTRDAEIAEAMGRDKARNRDVKGHKGKKAAALAAIREEKAKKAPEKKEEDSDLDYGSEGEEDSDDEYVEAPKPWQKVAKNKKAELSSEGEPSDEDEEVDRGRASDEKANFVEADLEDYRKVTLPRRRLARWCREPYFDESVVGCFVRIGIGRDKKTQAPCYRLCRIKSVQTGGHEYTFPQSDKHSKPVSSNKLLELQFGKSVMKHRMLMVSDSRPSQEDVTRYVTQLKNLRKNDILLSKREAAKIRKIQDLLVTNYTYTTADIDKNIEAKKRSGKAITNIGLEKTRISIAVQGARTTVAEAMSQFNGAKVAALEANPEDIQLINTLEENIESARLQLESAEIDLNNKITDQELILKAEENRIRKIQNSSKVQNWVKVNQRAAKMNQNADFQSYKEQQEKEKRDAVSAPKFDPYARRKVKPKMLWEVGQTKEEEKKAGETPSKLGAAGDDAVNIALTGDEANKMSEKGSNRENISGTRNAALQSHQLDFDDEDLAQSTLLRTNGSLNGRKAKRARVRKGMSLAEYQEKKAAGTL